MLLPAQVSAVATVGGVGPLVPRSPLLPPDRLVIKTARRSPTAARALFAAIGRVGRARPEKTLDRFAAMLAEPDARLVRDDPDLRKGFLDDLRHPSPTMARATACDFWLFAREWDVDLASVAVPAHIWHGTDDRNVPVAHARVIAARCPTARLHIVEAAGTCCSIAWTRSSRAWRRTPRDGRRSCPRPTHNGGGVRPGGTVMLSWTTLQDPRGRAPRGRHFPLGAVGLHRHRRARPELPGRHPVAALDPG